MTGWFGGVGYRLLPVIAGLAFSACIWFLSTMTGYAIGSTVKKSDLIGYSIDARWDDRQLVASFRNGKLQRTKWENSSLINQFYFSKKGRIFHRRTAQYGDQKKIFEGIRDVNDSFDWSSNGEITNTRWMTHPGTEDRANTVIIMKLNVINEGGRFSCRIHHTLAKMRGGKDYVGIGRSGDTRIIKKYRGKQTYCRVTKGNVFKGEVGP